MVSASPVDPGNTIEENLTDRIPTFGQIEILTDPNGSEIYLNERHMGKTPALIESVPPGFYEVVLKQEGYNDVFERVLVKAGEKAAILKTLSLKDGVCSVSSNPSRASVYLDGKYKGTTPVVFYANEGTHKLSIKKTGYSKVSKEVNLSYDRAYVLEEKLHLNLLVYLGMIFILLVFVIFSKKYSKKLKTKVHIKMPERNGLSEKITKALFKKNKKIKEESLNSGETEKKEDITEKSLVSASYVDAPLIETENYSKPEFAYTIKKKKRD